MGMGTMSFSTAKREPINHEQLKCEISSAQSKVLNRGSPVAIKRYDTSDTTFKGVRFGVKMAGAAYSHDNEAVGSVLVLNNSSYDVLACTNTGKAYDQGLPMDVEHISSGLGAMCLQDIYTKEIFLTFAGMKGGEKLDSTNPVQMLLSTFKNTGMALQGYLNGLSMYRGNSSEQLQDALLFTTECWQRYGKPTAAYGHSMGALLAGGAAGSLGIPVGGFAMPGTNGKFAESLAELHQQHYGIPDSLADHDGMSTIIAASTMYNVCTEMGRWECSNRLQQGSYDKDVPIYLIHNKADKLPSNYWEQLAQNNIISPNHGIQAMYDSVMEAQPGSTFEDLQHGEENHVIMQVTNPPTSAAAAAAASLYTPLELAYLPDTPERQQAAANVLHAAPDVAAATLQEYNMTAWYLKEDGSKNKVVSLPQSQRTANPLAWAATIGAIRAFNHYLATEQRH